MAFRQIEETSEEKCSEKPEENFLICGTSSLTIREDTQKREDTEASHLPAAQVVLTREEVQHLIDARKLCKEYLDNELRMVLIGKTGVGKSATANTIVGENCFESKFGCTTITKCCAKKHAMIQGRKVLVVDTPGIFDTETDPEVLQEEIRKCINIASPGPHAVLFVLKIGERYKTEDYNALLTFLSYFGAKMFDHVIGIFTCADKILEERMTLEEYIENGPPQLLELLKLFGNRKIAFNNKFDRNDSEPQVAGLLTMIEGLKTGNLKNSYYVDDNFKRAELELQEKEKQIEHKLRNEYLEKHHDFRKNCVAEFDKKLKAIQHEYEKKLSELRMTLRDENQRKPIALQGVKLTLHNIEKKIPKPKPEITGKTAPRLGKNETRCTEIT